MSGMDLNQNTQNFERDRLAERVNKVERLMDSFNMEVLESVGNTGKLRVKNISTVNGSLQQVRGKEIDVSTDASSVLDDGDATNRYLVWNATTEAWEPSELTYPAGTTSKRYLIWDSSNSKWIAGELKYPAGSATNRYLTWDTTNSKWTAGELEYPAGDSTHPLLVWNTGTSIWEANKAAVTALEPSSVDGHVLETYDDSGTKKVRWGYTRMKDI